MENKVAIQYYCLMKCEGEKRYDEPGSCPDCNMHLQPVGEQNDEKQHPHKSGDVIIMMKSLTRQVMASITAPCAAKETKTTMNRVTAPFVVCT